MSRKDRYEVMMQPSMITLVIETDDIYAGEGEWAKFYDGDDLIYQVRTENIFSIRRIEKGE